jgi:hypothetical protein
MYNLIIQPVIALMALTFVVWCYMYFLRLKYVIINKISVNRLETPEQCNSVLPSDINKPSNNLKNLFEVPVIFYAICILCISINVIDTSIVYLAWCFVILRILHSIFHCFSKNVIARFCAYFASSIILWLMFARFSYIAVNAI